MEKQERIKLAMTSFKVAFQFIKDVIDDGEDEGKNADEILRDIKMIDFNSQEGEILADQLRSYL